MPKHLVLLDTVCLCNFILADAADSLHAVLGNRMSITIEVFDEVLAGLSRYPALEQVHGMVPGKRAALVRLNGREYRIYATLLSGLGRGEASCIAVAESRSGVVATDDRAARAECARRGIGCTGTIGILKKACLTGRVTAHHADSVLARMIDMGFYSPVKSISALL